MTKIYIATHKQVQLPQDEVLTPIFVGATGKQNIKLNNIAILRDDSGDNISHKNPYYCELTAVYWAWKNTSDTMIGLMHYRRFFDLNLLHRKMDYSRTEQSSNVYVPAKRRYYIESLYSHYSHTFDASHLDRTRDIIAMNYPGVLPYVDKAYKSTWGYMFNMFVMPRDKFDEYCSFLFDVLEKLEQSVDVSQLDAFNQRLFGRVSEILFTAWAMKLRTEGTTLVEIPVKDLEPVNWPKKILWFLAAKFLGKKYTKSC